MCWVQWSAADSRTGKVYIVVKQTAGPTDILCVVGVNNVVTEQRLWVWYLSHADYIYCDDVEWLLQELECTHNPEERRHVADLSKFILQPVLLYNGNIHPSMRIAHYVITKETYENMNCSWKLNLLTCSLTQWSRVLPEKLTGSQLDKKIPAFYGAWKMITTFTSDRHLTLFLAILIH